MNFSAEEKAQMLIYKSFKIVKLINFKKMSKKVKKSVDNKKKI